jgi:hypothetical protein
MLAEQIMRKIGTGLGQSIISKGVELTTDLSTDRQTLLLRSFPGTFRAPQYIDSSSAAVMQRVVAHLACPLTSPQVLGINPTLPVTKVGAQIKSKPLISKIAILDV